MSNQEKIKEALCRIDEGLDAINSDEDWLRFLLFQSSFYNYSFGNTMLIYMQNPEATYVKGYKAWNKLGRYVRKGEKGIAILAPCFQKVTKCKEAEEQAAYLDEAGGKEERRPDGFRVAYLYDISQTEGSDEQLPVLVRGLSGNGEQEKGIYEKLKAYISTKQPVEEVAGSASKGSYSVETGVIRVRSDMEYAQKIKTILHEYAHHTDFFLHPDRKISRNKRELVAESVAFVVSLRLGMDTSSYSIGYLKTWLKDRGELKEIADCVQKVASAIISELAGSFDPAFSCLQEETVSISPGEEQNNMQKERKSL